MLLCARNNLDRLKKERLITLMQQDLDWNYLTRKADIHGLTAFLYYHINLTCPEKVPADSLSYLKERFDAIFRKNLLLTNELTKIIEHLNSNHIKVIPYKGPFLALLANQNLSLRQFGDLDILVDKKDVLKIKELLISYGYEPQLHLKESIEAHYIKSQREFQFFNKKAGVYLEIHWNPININFSFPIDPNFIWDKKKLIKRNIEGFEVLSLPIEELIIILSVHAAGHFWSRLSWFCDISELIRNRKLDYDKLFEISRNLGLEKIIKVTILLVHELLDLELPENILNLINNDKGVNKLSQQIMKNFMFNEFPSGINEPFFQFKIREKRWNGFKDCIRMLFRPTWEEWEIYQPNKYFYPFCYTLRPLNVLKKYIIPL